MGSSAEIVILEALICARELLGLFAVLSLGQDEVAARRGDERGHDDDRGSVLRAVAKDPEQYGASDQ